MNGPAKGSPASGTKFGNFMVDQRPVYDSRKLFRKKLKRGRPSKNQKPQYWVR